MDHFRDLADPALRPSSWHELAVARPECTFMRSSLFRFLLAALLLIATALLLRARSTSEVFPSRTLLESFPRELNGRSGTDVPIEKQTLEMLGPGDFLVRVYTSPDE